MKIIKNPKNGERLDATLTMYPSLLEVIEGRAELTGPTSNFYGFVVDGSAEVRSPHFLVRGEQGTFFSGPGDILIEASGKVIVIQRFGYRGVPLAGRIEKGGRLVYIDGCTSTVLVPPARIGDPALNYLHIPPNTNQSRHTHPSIRLGVIASGNGFAVGKDLKGLEWKETLERGTVFLLDAQEMHSFSTSGRSESLEVITFHPDSDWGPADNSNPMINRTHTQPAK